MKEPFTVLQLVSHDPSAPSAFRFVLEICPASPSSPFVRHSISDITETSFRLLATLSSLTFAIFRILGTFHLTSEMVTALSTLTRLKELHIIFQSPQSWADQAGQRPTRLTCVSLPVLSSFYFFKGDSKYLENIVAQIDTPPLENFFISFFDSLILNTPRLRQLLIRPGSFHCIQSRSSSLLR